MTTPPTTVRTAPKVPLVSSPAPRGVELADEVVAAVLGVDGVLGLPGGMFGEAATSLPGLRVTRGCAPARTPPRCTPPWPAVLASRLPHVLVPGPVHVTGKDVAPCGTDPEMEGRRRTTFAPTRPDTVRVADSPGRHHRHRIRQSFAHHCTDWTQTMTTSTLGLLAGLLLGIAAAVGGFGAFLLALVLGVLGYIVGGALDGQIDVSALLRGKGRG